MIAESFASITDSYTLDEVGAWIFLKEQCLANAIKFAHPTCLKGIEELGLLSSKIPRTSDINKKLAKFDWEVIAVKGFMPPRQYLGNIANRKLPIAVNMRSPANLLFNAEPDIFHEVFGHVCMLVDADFRNFIEAWGKVSVSAFQHPGEQRYYESLRILAEKKTIDEMVTPVAKPIKSEATYLAHLGWWTVECGIIKEGDLYQPYGAAILSSIREMKNVISTNKISRLTPEALDTEFDPTELQPQYFYTGSFREITDILERMESRLASKRGGRYGLDVAIASGEHAICKFASGKKIRGRILDYSLNDSAIEIRVLVSEGFIQTYCFPLSDLLVSVYPSEAERYLCSL